MNNFSASRVKRLGRFASLINDIYPVADPSAVYVDHTVPVRGLTVCNQRIVMTHLF